MKIAYLGIKGLPSKGGAERVVEAIVNRLKTKHQLTIYCGSHYSPKDARLNGIKLIRIPCFAGKHLASFSLFLFSSFHALFRGRYDLVHVHNAEACFIVPFLKLKYPVIATSHGSAYARDKWGRTARFLLRLMDRLFVFIPDEVTSVSLTVAQDYEERFGKKIRYLPNGVDNELPVNGRTASETLSRHKVCGDYLLFSAGRMDRTKGCDLLLKAFRKIPGDQQLVVIGDSETDPQHAQSLRELADQRVHFIPFIADKSELFGILSKARIFIFPSTVEAMSMALLEAASLGVPTICSDISANTAVLPEGTLHFRSGDVEDLYEKLTWALNHFDETKQLGLKAQKWVRERFSWDEIAEQYNQLYHSLTASSQ